MLATDATAAVRALVNAISENRLREPHAPVGDAPPMLLRRASIRDDRLKPTAIRLGEVHDNSCSHDESLNCFARFGNLPIESNRQL